jgi:hypothetical protein
MRTLAITGDVDRDRREVISAMLYPRDEALRAAYVLRNRIEDLARQGKPLTLSPLGARGLLDLPSRAEVQAAADAGIRHGVVAGSLLLLVYAQWQRKDPEPSLRSALRFYREWTLGKKYGDGKPMKYSDVQLRAYFSDAAPAAHLWAAFELLKLEGERKRRTAFHSDLPRLLGLARNLEDFATGFVPKRTKLKKPVIERAQILSIPNNIEPLAPRHRLL